jgi:hypothetical protein
VHCPPVVPRGLWQLQYSDASRSGYQLEMHSPTIHYSSAGHWAVGAGPPGGLERVLHPSTRELEPGVTKERTRLGPVPATRYVVPPDVSGGGVYRGHVSFAWTSRGVEYYLSLHGRRNGARARAMAQALAASVRAAGG